MSLIDRWKEWTISKASGSPSGSLEAPGAAKMPQVVPPRVAVTWLRLCRSEWPGHWVLCCAHLVQVGAYHDGTVPARSVSWQISFTARVKLLFVVLLFPG